MKTITQRFTVEKIVKFGMLFGYKVYDNVKNVSLPYEYDEDEQHKAETKAELKNIFYS